MSKGIGMACVLQWLAGTALLSSLALPAFADQRDNGGGSDVFVPGTLVVSRVHYDGTANAAHSAESFPLIFNDPTISGIQGSIFLDSYRPEPNSPLLRSFPLTALSAGKTVISTSFSSKSEGSLTLSVDGHFLTYMGYIAPTAFENVSNTETTALVAQTVPLTIPDPPPPAPEPSTFDRAVALVKFDGSFSVTPESNAYSGDNPRGAITVDGNEFYMVGNGDNTLNKDGSGPGTTLGARLGAPGSTLSIQLGTYTAADRPDESAKNHIKDNNFRGVGIFNDANGTPNLYVSKGSGSNGDDGVFQVENGKVDGLPPGGTTNTINQLLGVPGTSPITNKNGLSPLTPFAFFFADPNTLYIADEGNATVIATNPDNTLELTGDPLAGLQKWVFVGGAWQLAYVLQDGLQLDEPQRVPGYPAPTYRTGLRNMTGHVNGDGTVTLYAITAQASAISGGEPDPTALVAISDVVAATTPPAHGDDNDGGGDGDDHGIKAGRFVTLQTARAGDVLRGVAFAPTP